MAVPDAHRRGDRGGDDLHRPGVHRRRDPSRTARQRDGAGGGGIWHRLHVRPLLGVGLVASTPDDMATLRDPLSPLDCTFRRNSREGRRDCGRIRVASRRNPQNGDAGRTEGVARRTRRADRRIAQCGTAGCVARRDRAGGAPGYVAGGLSFLAFLLALAKLPESLPAEGAVARSAALSLTALTTALSRPVVGPTLAAVFLTTFAFRTVREYAHTVDRFPRHGGQRELPRVRLRGVRAVTRPRGLVRRLLPKLGEIRMSVAGTILMTIGLVGIAWAGGGDSEVPCMRCCPWW